MGAFIPIHSSTVNDLGDYESRIVLVGWLFTLKCTKSSDSLP